MLRILFVFGGLAALMATATVLYLLVKIPYMRAQRVGQLRDEHQKLQWLAGRQEETIRALNDIAKDNRDIDRPLADLMSSEVESHYATLRKSGINPKDLYR